VSREVPDSKGQRPIPPEYLKAFRVQRITKQSAAVSQLESAIILWIKNRDTASVHTLAVASSDCMRAISKGKGRHSPFRDWIRAQPRKFQDKAAEAQNFLKHGAKDWDKGIQISPLYSEMLMYDSIVSYERVVGKITPLMRAFATRFAIENRKVLGEKFEAATKGLDVDYVASLDRTESAMLLIQLSEFDAVEVKVLPPHLARLLKSP
jgi:hypothetical protein